MATDNSEPNEVENERLLLARLPYAKNAVFNHYSRQGEPLCLPNTRRQVLGEIMAWARGESSGGERIYWLNGMAGTGKSTIARTIARRCHDEGRLGATFFFSRGGGDLESARKFVTSIAVQLAQHSSALRQLICAAVRACSDIADKSLIDQWRQLVLHPFSQLGAVDEPPAPLVVVVDALDECHDEDEIAFVLELLSQTSGLAVRQLRIFLTSRPEVPIRSRIASIPESQRRHLILHRIEPAVVDDDLYVFFEHSLGVIRGERALHPQWPGPESLQQLVQAAGGLFIWAATACRFIRDGRRFAARRLGDLLRRDGGATTTAPERGLDSIYLTVLRNAVGEGFADEDQDDFCNTLKNVLGSIVVLFSSLAPSSLALLLNLPDDDMAPMMSDLHSILDISDDTTQPIRLHHASFRDFLLNNARCIDNRFWVDERCAHKCLAECCLRVLNDNLRQDICDLKDAGALTVDVDEPLVTARLPHHLRYACLYWVDHVRRGGNESQYESDIEMFLQKHFLHWLEALSLLGELAKGVELVADLGSLYVSQSKTSHRADGLN